MEGLHSWMEVLRGVILTDCENLDNGDMNHLDGAE